MIQNDLFATEIHNVLKTQSRIALSEGATLLRGFAKPINDQLALDINNLNVHNEYVHFVTPGGGKMSVATLNCGDLGWVSDAAGYRYSAVNPKTRCAWPHMPQSALKLAQQAADLVGYPEFKPNACLINRYDTGNQMGLHQDKNESQFSAPIVSISLGVPAVFLWGGLQRHAPVQTVPLFHGDVLVWGGASRLRFHGVKPIRPAYHPFAAQLRINLTFRCA